MKAIRGALMRGTQDATSLGPCSLQDTLSTAAFPSSGAVKVHQTAYSRHGFHALNHFTSGRWLWNEKQQLACRYLNFNLSALLQIASFAIGSKSCTRVLKISEGQYNKVFQINMDDGQETIAKLPSPNAGRPHATTASEVATMDFV